MHEHGPLRSCRLEAPIYVWIRFQSKCTKLGTGCQSEWGFEGSLPKARRLSEKEKDTRDSEKVLPELNRLAQGL